jgi:septal ring factor EnvC (AmiA/AmiB activator)
VAQLTSRQKHLTSALSDKEKTAKSTKKEFAKLETDLKDKEKGLSAIEGKLKKLAVDPKARADCEAQLKYALVAHGGEPDAHT